MPSLRTFLRIRKEVRQRPTLGSLILLAGLFGLFLEAYMHNFNLVYIVLFFLFALALAAVPVGLANIGRVEAKPLGCGRLFAKREGACRVELRNLGERPAYGLDLLCCGGRLPLPPLEPARPRLAHLPVLPERRGRFRAGPWVLESRFPLGTLRFEKEAAPARDTLVYPEPRGVPLAQWLAQRRSRYGHEEDFDGLASYDGRESASRIHWPSVAKGEPMVKRFETRLPQEETVELDFASAGSDDEARLSQLTLWILECEKRGLPFVVRMPEAAYSSRKESVDAILERLALYRR